MDFEIIKESLVELNIIEEDVEKILDKMESILSSEADKEGD